MFEQDEDVSLKQTDSLVTTSLETTSIPPSSVVQFTDFGDSACGEPLLTQRLLIDFTPQQDVDNDFVQRKCCAFWEFVSNRSDLQNLMVEPVSQEAEECKETYAGDTASNMSESDVSTSIKEKTAVSVLEFVEEKGLIDRAFEAKILQSHCSLGSKEYRENELTSPSLKAEAMRKKKLRLSTATASKRHVEDTAPQVMKLCQNMREWDSKHPKSMEPPGHPPALSHAIMQRKIPIK